MGQITAFPGTIAARNALIDPKTSPEARTAAHDLLWAASCEDYRCLTDAELAQSFPFIVSERFPRLRPPEPYAWLIDDNRGAEMLGRLMIVMGICAAALIIWAFEAWVV